MTRYFSVIACAFVAMFAFAGCAKDTITPHLAYPQMHGDGGVRVVEFKETRQGGVLAVQAELKNSNSSNTRAYYRFRWLDAAGNIIGTNAVWKPIVIYGNQNVIITDSAPSRDASDYRLELNAD